MKTNKFTKLMLLPALLLAASACSSDDPVVDNGNNGTDGDVYMTFTLVNTTDGSRADDSTTSDSGDEYVTSKDGIEYGKDNENTINNVSVFIVPKIGDTKSYVTGKAHKLTSSNDKQNYTVAFDKNALKDFEDSYVHVIVFCNMSGVDYDKDKPLSGKSWGDGTAGHFQMTNASASDYNVKMPSDFSLYNTVSYPFNLGTIRVERSAARMDMWTADSYAYKLQDVDKGDVTITLSEAAILNMSNNWYALRRVVANDADYSQASEFQPFEANATAPTVLISGTETTTNFVIDTDWEYKNKWISTNTDYSNLDFTNPFNAKSTDVQIPTDAWKSIVSKEDKDDTDSEWNSSKDKGDYHIWQYLNENTLPQGAQYHGLTTGVVFKGEITAANNAIADSMAIGRTIYVFQNTLYGTWAQVKKCAKDNPALQVAVDNTSEVFWKNNKDEYITDESGNAIIIANKEEAADAGFTAYSPERDEDGNLLKDNEGKYHYYTYYYYWNRHNDNGVDNAMGPMEFAVVRNNVYKLKVKSILKYGHPTPGGDDPDPDPEDPDDPDESDDVYFQVSLKVMPWVVRINNIEF